MITLYHWDLPRRSRTRRLANIRHRERYAAFRSPSYRRSSATASQRCATINEPDRGLGYCHLVVLDNAPGLRYASIAARCVHALPRTGGGADFPRVGQRPLSAPRRTSRRIWIRWRRSRPNVEARSSRTARSTAGSSMALRGSYPDDACASATTSAIVAASDLSVTASSPDDPVPDRDYHGGKPRAAGDPRRS